MCSVYRDKRPNHLQTRIALEGLILELGAPDMGAFGQANVQPLSDARPRIPPHEHPHYADVGFLEQGLEHAVSATDRPIAPVELPTIDAFLAKPDWPSRQRELDDLLYRTRGWDPGPFIEILSRAATPAWKFWAAKADDDEVVAAFRVLTMRPSLVVVGLARRLAASGSAPVRKAAKALLENQG
jgi:hypothetical protein